MCMCVYVYVCTCTVCVLALSLQMVLDLHLTFHKKWCLCSCCHSTDIRNNKTHIYNHTHNLTIKDTNVPAYPHTHTRMHAYLHTYAYSYRLIRMFKIYAYINTYKHAYIHTYIHAPPQTNTRAGIKVQQQLCVAKTLDCSLILFFKMKQVPACNESNPDEQKAALMHLFLLGKRVCDAYVAKTGMVHTSPLSSTFFSSWICCKLSFDTNSDVNTDTAQTQRQA